MGNKIRLFVNVDHVATLREARKTVEPDPLAAALLAEQAGADGILSDFHSPNRSAPGVLASGLPRQRGLSGSRGARIPPQVKLSDG